jgi:hypothetical protein
MARVKKGEQEYGLRLRAPSPTRRFNAGLNSWSGRSSPNSSHQQRGEDSGGVESSNYKGKQSQMEVKDGGRTRSPVPPKQNDARPKSEGVSGTPEDQSVNHGIRTVIGGRSEMKSTNDYGEFPVEDLTLKKRKILSNEHEAKGISDIITQRKEKGAGFMRSINDGQKGMAQGMDATIVEEKGNMTSINDSGKFLAGVSAATKRNFLTSKQKEKALNEHSLQRQGTNDGPLVRNVVSHVENDNYVPPQSKVMTHVQNELIEPGHSNPVPPTADSRTEARPRGGQVMEN